MRKNKNGNDTDEQSKEKIIKHKGFVIDKDKLNKSKIGTDKFTINKGKVEESLKRSVSSENSIKKAFKKENKTEYIPTFRDYSGKIKYDSIKNNAKKESAAKESTTFDEAVKTDSKIVKAEDNSKAFKTTETVKTSNNIVKSNENAEGSSFKYQDNKNTEKVVKSSAITSNSESSSNKAENRYSKAIKNHQKNFVSNKSTTVNPVITEPKSDFNNANITYKDKISNADNVINEQSNPQEIFNTDKQLNVNNSVIEYSVENVLSKTAKNQIKENKSADNVINTVDNKLLKKQIKKSQQETFLKNRTQSGYNKTKKSASISSSIKNVINDIANDSPELEAVNTAINIYEGAKIAKRIAHMSKESFNSSADFTESIIERTQLGYNKLKNIATYKNQSFNNATINKPNINRLKINKALSNKTVKNVIIDKPDSIKAIRFQRTQLGYNKLKNIINTDKSSDKLNYNKTDKPTKANYKKENNPHKKKKINPQKIEEAKKKYGIIEKNDYSNNVLKEKNNFKPFSNYIIRTSVRNVISNHKEDSLTFKAIDKTITYYEATRSTTLAVAKGVNTIKSGAKAISNSYRGLKKATNTISRLQKLSATNRKKFIKQKIMKKAKAMKKATMELVKAGSKKLLFGIVGFFLIFILFISVVGGIITAFSWQTSTDLDTTLLLKVISEEDYKMQKKWFDKGKTMLEIKEQNNYASQTAHAKFDEYYYCLAVDVPPDYKPASEEEVDKSKLNTIVTVGLDSSGHSFEPYYTGFNEIFYSSDELLEELRWTTDDYRAALAYLQIKNDNLGWFSNLFGIGEIQLKASAKQLHDLTHKQYITVETRRDSESTFSFEDNIYSTSFSNDTTKKYYFFGRKFSVKYLIENDYIKFDEYDENNNKNLKEQFENIYNYGNIAVANLSFPLELKADETIDNRISKHFGTQLALSYDPPTPIPDEKAYGTVSAYKAYHYAADLSADKNDKIYAPISGLCKVRQRENRGFEYVISTAYNDNKDDFDFTKDGYLIKISCSSSSSIPLSATTMVNKGDILGKVADNIKVNYEAPKIENDTENEDIFANYLFPCSTSTRYSHLSHDEMEEPEPNKNHIHIEMYKLPCDFSDINSIQENVLAPELFFEYPELENIP